MTTCEGSPIGCGKLMGSSALPLASSKPTLTTGETTVTTADGSTAGAGSMTTAVVTILSAPVPSFRVMETPPTLSSPVPLCTPACASPTTEVAVPLDPSRPWAAAWVYACATERAPLNSRGGGEGREGAPPGAVDRAVQGKCGAMRGRNAKALCEALWRRCARRCARRCGGAVRGAVRGTM